MQSAGSSVGPPSEFRSGVENGHYLIYDYPDLKKGLDREGIPNLLLETELQSLAVGQIKTRVQAFAEILRSPG